MATKPPVWEAELSALVAAQDADVFLFSAAISRSTAQQVRSAIHQIEIRKNTAFVILTTLGGDPDAAYLIARAFKSAYKRFVVCITSTCKSAGTLIVIGADEIVMTDCGELGPLDIQLGKDDELFKRSSGLDLSEAIRFLQELSWEVFQQNFVKLKSGTNITTKTAADIAQGIARGIIEPIASQVDPIKLGEVNRSLVIAREYGTLLNPRFENFEKLISGYPSHSFVIDRWQAKELFSNLRTVTKEEAAFEKALGALARDVIDTVYVFKPFTPSPNDQPTEQPSTGNQAGGASTSDESTATAGEPANNGNAVRT